MIIGLATDFWVFLCLVGIFVPWFLFPFLKLECDDCMLFVWLACLATVFTGKPAGVGSGSEQQVGGGRTEGTGCGIHRMHMEGGFSAGVLLQS